MLPKLPVHAFTPKFAFVLILLIFPCSHAQDVPRLALSVKEEMPMAAGLVRYLATAPPVCDGAGNIYMQIAEPAPAEDLAQPVTKISADGQHLTTFSLNSAPGVSPKSSIDSFTVTPRGEVFVLAYIGDLPQFVTFHDDGQFDSTGKLDLEIFSARFAVFPTGEFLVRGIKASGPPGERRLAPFTGLFDRNGRFLKEVTLPDEIPFWSRAEFNDEREFRKQSRAANEAMWFSQAFSADDGNVYMVRPTKPLSVEVVSPNGEIVRRLTLKPPSPSFQAGCLKVAGGKIVVEYYLKIPGDPQNRVSDFTYSVFDAGSGDKLYDYYWPTEPGGIFACYTPTYFTFLKVGENGLSLVHSSAR
jgi:hypothetical protein